MQFGQVHCVKVKYRLGGFLFFKTTKLMGNVELAIVLMNLGLQVTKKDFKI